MLVPKIAQLHTFFFFVSILFSDKRNVPVKKIVRLYAIPWIWSTYSLNKNNFAHIFAALAELKAIEYSGGPLKTIVKPYCHTQRWIIHYSL